MDAKPEVCVIEYNTPLYDGSAAIHPWCDSSFLKRDMGRRMKKDCAIIAAGGGYDILTSHLLAEQLKLQKADLIGMLNPKFHHFYFRPDLNAYMEENAVNLLENGMAIRYKTSTEYASYIKSCNYRNCSSNYEVRDFMDGRLVGKTHHSLYNFSLKYGWKKQLEFLLQYKKIILCDVGGDILYAGNENCEVKTPIIDAYALMLTKKCLDAGCNCEIYIIAPGSDMELTPEHIAANLNRVESVSILIEEKALSNLWALYQEVRLNNSGHTIQRIYEAFNGGTSEYKDYMCQIHKCNVELSYRLNPLAQFDTIDEIIKNYNSKSL